MYNQLCIWEGIILDTNLEDFDNFFKGHGFDVKFETEYKTLPDLDEDGNEIEGTGGRNDLLFYINDNDIGRFAIWRLEYGIRWWEDFAFYNGHSNIVPKEILEKYPPTW